VHAGAREGIIAGKSGGIISHCASHCYALLPLDYRVALKPQTEVTICVCVCALQRKCEQYWPETGSRTFDDLAVELISTEQFADFKIRTFRLSKVRPLTIADCVKFHEILIA